MQLHAISLIFIVTMTKTDKISLKDKTIFDRVRDYYRGERISNAILILLGLGAIIWTLALYLWRQGQFSTGIFYSALPLSIFFIVTGSYRFIRSLKRYKKSQDNISGLDFLIEEEFPHLVDRLERFRKKRKVDIIGFLTGMTIVTLAILAGWNHLILGTAISLTIFSSLLLVFDLFGQFRVEELIHHIQKIKG